MRVLGAAFGTVVALLPAVALATSTPDPQTLRRALVGPPDPSWIESTPGTPDTLEGSFDATYYVNLSWDDQATRDDVRNRLAFDGFLGGYGRTFEKMSTKSWIVEDVKAFPDFERAISFWAWSKTEFHDDTSTVDASAILNSFADEYTTSGFYGTEVLFPKNTYVYTIVAGSYTAYMPKEAVAQALAAYSYVPEGDVPASPAASSRGLALTATKAFQLGVAVLAIVLVLAGVAGATAVILVAGTRNRQPAVQTRLSPDGNYLWDGTTWRPFPKP